MKDICEALYTNMGNYIIYLLIDGIYAKISNINTIKLKHLVRLCHYTNLYIGVVLLGEENDQSFANNELDERLYRHYGSPQLERLFLG